MKVHEIMTTEARCVGPDNNLVEAAGLMRVLDVGALPICDDDRLAGMITDRDIVLRAVADGRDVNSTPVREVMSPGIVYVFADQEVEEAARLMEGKQIRRLPVLNREKRLVGIVSLGDVAVSSQPAFSGMALKEVSEPASANAQRHASPTPLRRDPAATRAPSPRRSGQRRGTTKRTSARKRSASARKQSSSRQPSRGRQNRRSGATTRRSRTRQAATKK